MAESVNFDRIADRYDESRGGPQRGVRAVERLAPHLPAGRLVEIGAGTGLVTEPLAARGWEVLGVDLSTGMLAKAQLRVPGRFVVGDAQRLPLADGSVDAAVGVHVLHLVADIGLVLAEVARVLRPGGRLGVLDGAEAAGTTDVEKLLIDLNEALRTRAGLRDRSVAAASAPGLRLVAEDVEHTGYDAVTPAQIIEGIEGRLWSALWDVPPAQWNAVVEPALAAFRALPDQDRPRAAEQHLRTLVFEA